MASGELQKRVVRLSATIYFSLSLVLAGVFFMVSTALGYNDVARYGGTAWVFMLSMIITMPTITPLIKKRLKG